MLNANRAQSAANPTYPLLLALLLMAPTLAGAHEAGADANGFLVGVRHPVLGLDHLLAMIAVGVVSAVAGGVAIWQVPLIFVGGMLIGALLGGYAFTLPGIEYGIVCSVIALGALLAIDKEIPILIISGLVSYFGIMHGYAHGSEMPEMTSPLLYGSGFITGTVGLHLLGVLIGVVSQKLPKGDKALRITGGAVGCTGLFLLAQMVLS